MARPKKSAEGLSKPVSFRLAQGDYEKYLAKVAASGMSASEFFRDCVLSNKTKVVARPQASAEKAKLLFLFNKTSNNINQLAHRANSDHLAGKISEERYESILSELQYINRYLKAILHRVD